MLLNEDDFLNSLLSGMGASQASQNASISTTQSPPSTIASTASTTSTTRSQSTQLDEVQQLLQGADDWDWDEEFTIDEIAEADRSEASTRRLPERIVAPAVTEPFTPLPYTRCAVIEISELSKPIRQKVLTVRIGDKSKELCEVVLQNDWTFSEVAVGDTINVIGTYSTTSASQPRRRVEVTSQNNFIILHPDILMTATSVANSANCQRRPLISSLLSSDGGTSPALVWGTMLHEIMQACLAEGRWDDKFIDVKTDEIVRQGLGDLVKLDLTLEVAKEEIRKRAKGLQGFSQRFIGDSPKEDAVLSDVSAKKGQGTLLAICGLHDTEEDIWSPRFGLKGKLDASVQVVMEDQAAKSGGKVSVPLEIKTGRHGGIEHRAQTMLYTILMEERYGARVPAGLLYYTQSEEIIRVNAARNELRSLIQNRNKMVSYMMKRSQQPKPEVSASCSFLPPTEDDEYMCKKCYASDGCMLYRKAVEGVDDDSSPIAQMYNDKTGHLTPSQCEFFKQWEHLISLEEQDITRFRRELWTMGAEEREKTGRCFANMVIVPSDKMMLDTSISSGSKLNIHRYTYTFARKISTSQKPKAAIGSSVLSILNSHSRMVASPLSPKKASQPMTATPSLLTGQISKGDAVTVSIEPDFLSLARGYVLDLNSELITIGVDRELDVKTILSRKDGCTTQVDDAVFRIDRDELAAGISRIRSNLANLFYKGGDTKRLELVVDLKRPEFDEKPQDLSHVDRRTVNDDQRQAMEKVLSAQDYAILLGMPGTGKTSTIAEIIKELVRRGKSVLLSSYTHSAVDTILMKLQNVDFEILRLGNTDKIHPDVYKMSMAARPPATSVEMLERQLLSPPVVATTCLSIDHTLFSRRRFDVCIVDEASQITLPTCLGPLRFAEKFILVGDHHQLPPLVRSARARKGGLDVSLFRRLSEAHPHAVVELKKQYRMNEDIMKVSNTLIYNDRLACGNDGVAQRSLPLKNPKAMEKFHASNIECTGVECWLKDLVDPKRRVVFVDTDLVPAKDSRVGELVQNEVEAGLVAQLVKALVRGGVEESQIGVISLYRQQIKLLSHLIKPHQGVETLTADRSQGRDKDCIIISMCRSNDTNSIGDLLKDWRRLNVSFTRARSKLVIFGSRKTLSSSNLLQDFFELMERQSWIYKLPAGANSKHDVRAVKRKRDVEDKENGLPISHSSPRKKPRLAGTSMIGKGALLRGRDMLRDVMMDIQIL